MAKPLTAQEIFKKAADATVHLGIFSANGEILGTGSGFFVRPNYIVTNFHVISRATSATVIVAKRVDKEEGYKVDRIRTVDEKHDLAIVQVSAPGVKPLPLGDSDAVAIGDAVYVVGNPQRLEGPFSMGNISQIRVVGDVKRLQFNAPISRGNSGGPVLNKDGTVIGVVSFKIGDRRYVDDSGNLMYAVPSNTLKALLSQIEGVKPFFFNR